MVFHMHIPKVGLHKEGRKVGGTELGVPPLDLPAPIHRCCFPLRDSVHFYKHRTCFLAIINVQRRENGAKR